MSVSHQFLAIGAFRLLGALPVLRWPLTGGLVALAADLGDLVLMNYVFAGGLGDYQRCDKLWDLAYMLTFLIAAQRWHGPERSVTLILFGLRLAGVAAFLAGAPRSVLLVFPNLFELWFLALATRDHWAPGRPLGWRQSVALLLVLAAVKLPQEYLLHIDRRLDRLTLPEFLELFAEYLRSRW